MRKHLVGQQERQTHTANWFLQHPRFFNKHVYFDVSHVWKIRGPQTFNQLRMHVAVGPPPTI
eukprot:4736953-Pyramimonas_sp.AAC.1